MHEHSNLARARPSTPSCFGGLTAGVLDIADAFIVTTINGGTPTRVLQAIASGMLGREAYQGGVPGAALGLALHFLIALQCRLGVLSGQPAAVPAAPPVVCGHDLWPGVWAFMYYVVLPITFGRPYACRRWPLLLNQLGIHALGVGLPIALLAWRSARAGRVQVRGSRFRVPRS